jgi:hypothetical protein
MSTEFVSTSYNAHDNWHTFVGVIRFATYSKIMLKKIIEDAFTKIAG